MGRKILISSLGVSMSGDREYRKSKYKFDTGEIYETSFIAAALAEYLKVDKIIFIGTGKSMWGEVYKYFTERLNKQADDDFWLMIEDKSINSNHLINNMEEADLERVMESVDEFLRYQNEEATMGSEGLMLKYGLNQDEIWDNFDIIMEMSRDFKDGDEIYLDITHSFRSIPLFLYIMMDFVETLNTNNIKLSGLYYGMQEASWDLKSMGQDYTPVVDLTPLYNISRLVTGTHSFINYGDGTYLADTLLNLNDIDDYTSSKIKTVSDLVNINYLTDLQDEINSVGAAINARKEQRSIKYIRPIVLNFVDRLKDIEKASDFQLELSKWYFENTRYGHGYICLAEAILTKMCEIYEYDIANLRSRSIVNEEIFYKKNRYRNVKSFPLIEELLEINDELSDIRNRIAHASYYQGNKNYDPRKDIEKALDYYEKVAWTLNNPKLIGIKDKISIN